MAISQLRAELSAAEEAEDKPAIIELSRRIVAIAPNDFAAWETLARTQLEIKDFDRCAETLDAWQKALKQPPAAIEDFRGGLFAQRKDYQNAERHWLAFLARKPSATNAASIYDKLADLFVEQARWLDNATYRTKAIAAEDSAARRVFRACALLRLHKWDTAYADMEKANALDPSDAQVKEWLPQFERLKTFLPRIKEFDAQNAKSPNDAGLWLERARLFTLAQRPLLALDDCEHVISLQPTSMRARIETAEALQDAGRADDAAKLQVSRDLVRAEDKHVSKHVLDDLGEKDALILQKPRNVEALAGRSKALRELRQFTLALADARAALAIDDHSALAHFEAAHDLDGLGQPKDALVHAIKATELNRTHAVMWFYRGVLEAQRANFLAAIKSHTRSLAIRESVVALREREKCERRIGNVSEADADLRRIRDLEPRPE